MKISEYLDTKLFYKTDDCKFVDPFGNEIDRNKLKKQYDQFEVVEVKYELIAIIKVKLDVFHRKPIIRGRFFNFMVLSSVEKI